MSRTDMNKETRRSNKTGGALRRGLSLLLCLLLIFPAVSALAEIIVIGSSVYSGWYVSEANFPDEVFREYLLSLCKTDYEFLRDSVEIYNLKTMNVSKSSQSSDSWRQGNITSLKGIEHFTYLTKIYCGGNKIASLDVSGRPSLEILLASENQLTSIDVSNNAKLDWLGLDNNQLTSIDLSKNTALTAINLAHNKLTSLDVSNNTALSEINCYSNALTSLDVSKNINLEHLDCDNNPIKTLDVSKNIAMKDLSCWACNLKTLDVSKNVNLTSLDCSVNQITVLDLSKIPALCELVQTAERLHNVDENLDYFYNDTAYLLIDPWTKVIAGSTVSEATADAPEATDDPETTEEPTLTDEPENPPTVGDTFTVSGLKYKVTAAKTVSFTGLEKAKSKATVTIPATVTCAGATFKVTEIAAKAMYKDTKVATVSIGKNVKTVGKNAFASCTKLKTVKGGAAVTAIKDSVFSGCKVLKTFPAMGKLQTIGANALKSCVKLASFTLGAAVKSIGKNAFNGCKALKTITVKTTKLTNSNVGAGAFKGIYSKATFKCPKSKLKAYKTLFVKKGAPKTCKFK